jgi:transcriptional regulator with XRE-family HTH domain
LKSRSKKWNKKLGTILAKARRDQNLTQERVAKILRLASGQYISNIERGRCPVPLRTLIKLVRIYSLPPLLVSRVLLEIEEKKIKDEFLRVLERR